MISKRHIFLILLLITAYFPIFLHMDVQPIRQWDESLYALSAYKLAAEGELITNFDQFAGGPDMYWTRPPLITAMQAFCMKLFGYSEFAVRLPLKLFALLTVLLLFLFCSNDLRKPELGFFAGLILICSHGYIDYHVVRTGEHDTALVFFCLLAVVSYYRFLYQKHNLKPLIWLTAALILGTLTKFIVVLIFLPAFLVFALLAQKTRRLLDKRVLFAALTYIIVITAYFLFRESLSPGYSYNVWRYDIGGRFYNTLGINPQPFDFFWQLLISKNFFPWIYFLPVSALMFVVPGYFAKTTRKAFILIILCACWFFLIISSSATKHFWYAAPLYPLLSLWSAYAFYGFLEKIRAFFTIPVFVVNATMILLLAAMFTYPYYDIVQKVYKPYEADIGQKYGEWMRKLDKRDQLPQKFTIVHGILNMHALYYQTIYNETKDCQIEIIRTGVHFPKGDTVMACGEVMKKELYDNHQLILLDKYESCELLVINAVKE